MPISASLLLLGVCTFGSLIESARGLRELRVAENAGSGVEEEAVAASEGLSEVRRQEATAETSQTMPHLMAVEAVTRACINTLAGEFEALTLEALQDIVPKLRCESGGRPGPGLRGQLDCESLVQLLERRWTLEDQQEMSSSRIEQAELALVKAAIKQRLFAVSWARQTCIEHRNMPTPAATLQCLMDHAANGTSFDRKGEQEELSWRILGFKTPGLELEAAIQARWRLEEELRFLHAPIWWTATERNQDRVLGLFGRRYAVKEKVQAVRKEKTTRLNAIKSVLKGWGLSWTNTLKRCEVENEGHTFAATADLIDRLQTEYLEVVSLNKQKQCTEHDDDPMKQPSYCPEGSMPEHKRSVDYATYVKVWAVAFVAWKPTAVTASLALGAALGNPVLASTLAGAMALPGLGFAAATAVALPASFDWIPKCRCYPTTCDYDEAAESCLMGGGDKTSHNPFKHLPYPGSKCVAKRSPNLMNLSKIECEIQACSTEDYSPSTPGGLVYGTVGMHLEEKGIRNCLSTTGRFSDSLLVQATIPTAEGTPTDNTAVARAALYRSVGVAGFIDVSTPPSVP